MLCDAHPKLAAKDLLNKPGFVEEAPKVVDHADMMTAREAAEEFGSPNDVPVVAKKSSGKSKRASDSE